MNLIALPTTEPRTRRMIWVIAPAVALLVVLVASGADRPPARAGHRRPAGITWYHVTPMDFEVKINKDGELQSINNIDINRSRRRHERPNARHEGSTVKKGDVLMTFDSSAIEQKIEDTTLDLQKAESDVTAAPKMKAIQESQNATNRDAAQVALTLASSI